MAPFFGVSIKHRFETFMILLWWIEPSLVFAFFVYKKMLFRNSFPTFWPFAIPYLIWIYVDKAPERGGRRIEWKGGLDLSKNYIFGYHPHGIIAIGAVATFATEENGFSTLYPGIKPSLGTLAINFRISLHRDYLLAQGLCSVSKKSCNAALTSGPGRPMTIVVVGAAENLLARPNSIDLVLKKRLGFARIAVETEANLVPVLSFGENDMFDQVKNDDGSFARVWQKKIQKFLGWTMSLFHGRGIFNYIGLMPHCHFMCIVIGNSIDLPKQNTDKNFDEVVTEYHNLYDKYKDIYAKDRVM
ncbi:DAGAT-domain-containing protein [Backusella circina FSU 941]|nr:DAGAT-domain-containing protein [Backusella circina FSU 941]